MKIATFGTGQVGKGLSIALERAGHDIVYGTRSAQDADGEVRSYAAAAAFAEVILFAVPFSVAKDVIGAAGGLAGKIVIDCTNSVGMDEEGPKIALEGYRSAGEAIAEWAPEAHVFKTFNQVGAEILSNANAFEAPPFMLIAGPDDEALETVTTIVGDAGFDPQYLGSIKQAPLLEAFAMVWIHLAGTKRTGRNWALKRMVQETLDD